MPRDVNVFPHNFKLYLSIRPVTRKGYGSIALEANGLLTRGGQKGKTVGVSPKESDRKGYNEISKCKLKKYLFRNKTEESDTNCRYSMTITNSTLVA